MYDHFVHKQIFHSFPDSVMDMSKPENPGLVCLIHLCLGHVPGCQQSVFVIIILTCLISGIFIGNFGVVILRNSNTLVLLCVGIRIIEIRAVHDFILIDFLV